MAAAKSKFSQMSQVIKSILITGSGGQLGQEFQGLSSRYKNWKFHFTDSSSLDITDINAIRKTVEHIQPDVVINCAAYTNVELAESEPEKAFELNASAVENLALICNEKNILLIHFSTDYVFDGTKSSPYLESDSTNPINIYGKSKLDGEIRLVLTHSRYYILRISWLYGIYGKNFFKTMIRLADEKQPVKVVSDQIASPTYAAILASDVLLLLSRSGDSEKKMPDYGIYHYTNGGEASWFDFASEILKPLDVKPEPVTTASFPTKAQRPQYSKLSTELWEKSTDISITPWREALQQCIEKYNIKPA